MTIKEAPLQRREKGGPATNIDTSNWKTYRNEESGYSLKFPATMKQTDEQSFVDYSGGGFSFYLIPYERLKEKELISISRNDLLDFSLVPFIESGNIETVFHERRGDKLSMLLVEYDFKKEPQKHDLEAWNEGSILEEAFFQCGPDICAIRTYSDQLSSEKRVLFSTLLSTLHSIK